MVQSVEDQILEQAARPQGCTVSFAAHLIAKLRSDRPGYEVDERFCMFDAEQEMRRLVAAGLLVHDFEFKTFRHVEAVHP